jgi:hypothetical protein
MEQVKLIATRTTGQRKVGTRFTTNAAMARALMLLNVAKVDDSPEPERKKRAYKRRDMQAE